MPKNQPSQKLNYKSAYIIKRSAALLGQKKKHIEKSIQKKQCLETWK